MADSRLWNDDARTREDLAETLEQLGKGKCVLFIGAGCSFSSGIPTARGFIDIFEKQMPRAYARAAAPKSYMDCMEALHDAERRSLIRRYVQNKPVNVAHLAIAALMKEGWVDRVVTTNFDSLLVKACALMGVDPAVFDVASMATKEFDPGGIQMPAIFYLHGQSFGFTLLNTKKECTRPEIQETLKKLFEDVVKNRAMVVAGYSGEDPSSQFLLQIPRFGYGLYWVTYGKETPANDVRDNLLGQDKDAHVIEDQDADEFFVELATDLDCSPLRLLSNPFQQFGDLLENVSAPDGTPWAAQLQQAKIYVQKVATDSEHSPEETGEEVLVVPEAKLGLIVSLSTYSARGARYDSPQQLVDSLDDPDFREQSLTSNWGPMIVAVEHHREKLLHCWMLCSPEAKPTFEAARELVKRLAPDVNCYPMDAEEPFSIVAVQKVVDGIYAEALNQPYSLSPNQVICDITSGLTPLSGGMILATLDEARPLEYLVQGIPLVSKVDGALKALSADDIRKLQVLVSIKTSGDVVQEAAWRARS